MPASQIVSRSSPAVLLVNPTAGGGRAGAILPRLERFFVSQAIPVEVLRTASSEELAVRAKAAIGNGRRLLISVGGDGTFQGLANAAAGTNTLLGIIPAGGGNDFAAAAGLPKDPIAAAQEILCGLPRAMDLLRARTADGKVRMYAGGGGLGLDAETASYANGTLRHLPGALRYAVGAFCALLQFSAPEVTLDFPDGEHPQSKSIVLLAGVLNTPTYGAGLRFAPEAQPDDGWLDVVLVERLGALEVLEVLPRLIQSGSVGIPQIRRFRARRVRLSANRSTMFHGDGEILGPAPVDIEVARGVVQVLTGRPTPRR
jgi:diacylglycerol kinase (ATP)